MYTYISTFALVAGEALTFFFTKRLMFQEIHFYFFINLLIVILFLYIYFYFFSLTLPVVLYNQCIMVDFQQSR